MFLASLLVFLTFGGRAISETASFYGASYISVPLLEAKTVTEIKFRILTKRSDALLLFAAGEIDYCMIKLTAGRLKVYINLGSGESTVTSPLGLRLDDLNWHLVSFYRKDADVTLTIDGIHVTREKIPGSFFTLNVHYGLFIGGQGEFSELFLGHGDWLRGCMSDLSYNGVYPLQLARKRSGYAEAHEVSWSCAAEFRANTSSEISFIDDGSFMSLPNLIPRTGAKWELEMKTESTDGVLLYSSGNGENSDFVGAEIIGSQVHIVLDKGDGPAEVISDINVSDGKWHSVVINFNPALVQLIVDNKTFKQKLPASSNKYFDLGDVVYIGGVELNKRARALGQGLKTADSSLKGCIRQIRIASQEVGFPNAKITQGLLASCVWSYPCKENPCKEGATCVPRGVNSFLCLCEDSYCVKPEFPGTHTIYSKTLKLELIELSPIYISEGQNVLITPSHINIVLDYSKYGIRDSGVLFSTVSSQPPAHGRLAIEVWEKLGSPQTFTLLDLIRDKVRYVHDGSESTEDTLVLDLELSPGSGYVLPSYLQGQHRFSLHVNISSTNDAPNLIIPSTKIMHIVEGTRKLLLPSILNATDPDSPKDHLVYSVIGSESGRVERFNHPGHPVTSFTQNDVDNQQIYYYHPGPANLSTKLSLQVSDGQLSSAVAVMRVAVVPLSIKLVNNTGIALPRFSSAAITSSNLVFSANSEDPSFEIIFDVVEDCEFGSLQLRTNIDGNDTWVNTKSFSVSDLTLELVRYKHLSGNASQDRFKFQVTSQGVKFGVTYDFYITFIDLKLSCGSCHPIVLNGTKEILISNVDLQYVTTPVASLATNIVFTLKQLARFGNLFFGKDRRLVIGDNFTQADVDAQRIKYKLFRTSYVAFEDFILYEASAKYCSMKPLQTIIMNYIPPSRLPLNVETSINDVKVMEGGTSPILSSELSIKVSSVKSLVYEVFNGPLHGSLSLIDPILNTTENSVVHFTPSQISTGRLVYAHDGTESSFDRIQFMAISNVEDDFMIIGSLNVSISLVNDNVPVRVVSSVFRIVKGGRRLLTTRHIKFSDSDTDADVNSLLYLVKNGSGVFSANNLQPISQFTQGDLEEEKILIIEPSLTENPIIFIVSDGTHSTECSLDVRPSPPYVEITNNSHLVVSQGGEATITTSNLFSDTNIDIRLQDINYIVMSGPTHGELLITGVSGLFTFKQEDIESRNVVYKHFSSSVAQDRIQFKIAVQDIFTEGSLAVRVFPPVYWHPLEVVSNKTIYVEEYTSVLINREHVQVSQPGVPPSDITFLVVVGPKHGYLDIDGGEEERGGDFEDRGGVRAFDQATINAGKLYYVQSALNQTEDSIAVDVTNGVTWHRSLVIKILVIPSKFYLPEVTLTVSEGGSIKLPSTLFMSSTEFYNNKITDFTIINAPSHGGIVMSSQSRGLAKWTIQQAKNNVLKYVHDGSDTKEDHFTIIARSGKKDSEVAHVYINVVPVNDMSPKIVNKTTLKIWRGGSAILTSSHLAAIDLDTEPANVTFVIISASGGHVVNKFSNETSSVDRFSQEDINKENVLLVHDGEKRNLELELIVVDGKNKLGPIRYFTELLLPVIDLKINSGLNLFPLLKKPVTSKMLFSTSSDGREVTYKVTGQPKIGKLILLTSDGEIVAEKFTQTDIDENRVYYEHTKTFKESSAQDVFTFDVTASFIDTLPENVFLIEVSVFSGGLDQLFDLTSFTLNLEEGSSALIQLNMTSVVNFLVKDIGLLKPILKAILVSSPVNGMLCYLDECNVTFFTQSQLESGNIVYQHDHSDTLTDFFQLSICLEPKDVLLLNVTFTAEISPVNDQPFTLMTREPHISVVRGQMVQITKNDLYTVDLDSGPGDLLYEIVSGPSLGTVVLQNISTNKFTQQDVNDGLVYYKHSGALKPTSFYFRVSDRTFTPVYTVFHVTVAEINLDISVARSVTVQQGSSIGLLDTHVFRIQTNAYEMDIVFNVLTLPKHGAIHVNGAVSSRFSYGDLFNRTVCYVQENMSVPGDIFQLSYSNTLKPGSELRDLWVNVSVIPLLEMGNFSVVSGTKTRLDLTVLDATHLAKLSKGNPVYKILKKPKHGHLKKVIRSSGDNKILREKDLVKFTHEELRSGLIYYSSKRMMESVDDKFSFLLSSSQFQPAIGEFKFKVIGELPSTTFLPPKPPYPPLKGSSDEGGVEIASPNMSDDYLLGVSLVTGVVALALLVVGFVRCGSKHASFDDSIKSDLPDPLPRPPDDLLPSSPHIVMTNTPILSPPALPPSNAASTGCLNSSDRELNLRYPYGDEDWGNFAENGVPAKNNPLLRKNQYWV